MLTNNQPTALSFSFRGQWQLWGQFDRDDLWRVAGIEGEVQHRGHVFAEGERVGQWRPVAYGRDGVSVRSWWD